MIYIGLLLCIVGVGFITLSVIGLIKMSDLMLRLQVASKASTLGLICCLFGALIQTPTTEVGTRAGLTILFLFLTTPIAAQAISRLGHVKNAKSFKLRGDHLAEDLEKSKKPSA